MAITLNASTSSGLVQTADTSGTIDLQSAGATKLSVTSTGTSIAQYNPSASLITSGTAVASTSGTSIDFTSIPSWVKRITVMFNGVSTNGTANLLFRLGTSGGIASTGYSGRTSNIVSTTANGNNDTIGFVMGSGASAADIFYGSIIFTNLNANIWCAQGSFSQIGATAFTTFPSGAISLSGTLTTVRITTGNGTDTFDAGSINILYE